MTIGDPLRYSFEHRILPDGFLHHPEIFVPRFTFNDNELFELFDAMYKNTNVQNAYKKEEFKIDRIGITKDILVLKFTMPKPEATPLCHFIYCIFDPNLQHLGYYTIEMDEDADEMRMMQEEMRERLSTEEYKTMFGDDAEDEENREMLWVCGWDAKGNHLNYGKHYYEADDMLGKCVELYVNSNSDWIVKS